ncbi:rab-GTPase-TBC domain-containing protein [Paraphysoderma sedebokerense]|nr:rab-GTPase-TBC domain-containing protein [Paraphysoderma sedebokerense]
MSLFGFHPTLFTTRHSSSSRKKNRPRLALNTANTANSSNPDIPSPSTHSEPFVLLSPPPPSSSSSHPPSPIPIKPNRPKLLITTISATNKYINTLNAANGLPVPSSLSRILGRVELLKDLKSNHCHASFTSPQTNTLDIDATDHQNWIQGADYLCQYVDFGRGKYGAFGLGSFLLPYAVRNFNLADTDYSSSLNTILIPSLISSNEDSAGKNSVHSLQLPYLLPTVFLTLTEFCKLPPLDSSIPPLSPSTRLSLLRLLRTKILQIVKALVYLNQFEIVHRNWSREAVRVDDEGNVKLSEYGLYYVTGNGQDVTWPIGDPRYLPPEVVFTGGQNGGVRSDTWSLGILLFELYFGSVPGLTHTQFTNSSEKSQTTENGENVGNELKNVEAGEAFEEGEQELTDPQTIFNNLKNYWEEWKVERVNPFQKFCQKSTYESTDQKDNDQEKDSEKAKEFENEENQFIHFVLSCLEFDLSKRLKPVELLDLPFLSSIPLSPTTQSTETPNSANLKPNRYLPSSFHFLSDTFPLPNSPLKSLHVPGQTPSQSPALSASPSTPHRIVSTIPLPQLYYFWLLQGGDPEIEFKRKGIELSVPPILRVSDVILNREKSSRGFTNSTLVSSTATGTGNGPITPGEESREVERSRIDCGNNGEQVVVDLSALVKRLVKVVEKIAAGLDVGSSAVVGANHQKKSQKGGTAKDGKGKVKGGSKTEKEKTEVTSGMDLDFFEEKCISPTSATSSNDLLSPMSVPTSISNLVSNSALSLSKSTLNTEPNIHKSISSPSLTNPTTNPTLHLPYPFLFYPLPTPSSTTSPSLSLFTSHPLSSQPLSIRSKDLDYQFTRTLFFTYLLQLYPLSRDIIIKEARLDVPPLLRGIVWAAVLGVEGDVAGRYRGWSRGVGVSLGVSQNSGGGEEDGGTKETKDTKDGKDGKDGASDRQIDVDIPRCHAYHPLLSSPTGHEKLKRVLKTWLAANPKLVYWQGLDSVCAPFVALHFNNEAMAFACIQKFIPKFLSNFFTTDNSAALQEYLAIFKHLLSFHDPELSVHLDSIGFHPELYSISWFLTLFAHVLSLDKIYQLWDSILLGPPSLPLYTGVSILILSRSILLSSDFSTCIVTFSAEFPEVDMEKCIEMAVNMCRETPKSVEERNSGKRNRDSLSLSGGMGSPSGMGIGLVGGRGSSGMDTTKAAWWTQPIPLETRKAELSPRISLQDLIKLGNSVLVIDIRSADEYNKSHYPCSLNIQPNGLPLGIPYIKKNLLKKYVVVLDEKNGKGAEVATQLIQSHIPRVALLHGGIDAIKTSEVTCPLCPCKPLVKSLSTTRTTSTSTVTSGGTNGTNGSGGSSGTEQQLMYKCKTASMGSMSGGGGGGGTGGGKERSNSLTSF